MSSSNTDEQNTANYNTNIISASSDKLSIIALGWVKNTNSHLSLGQRLCKDKKGHVVFFQNETIQVRISHTHEFNPPSDGEYLRVNKQTNSGRKAGSEKCIFCSHIAAPVITSSLAFISQMLEVCLRSMFSMQALTERISRLIGPV